MATVPDLPVKDSRDWFAWAQGIDAATRELQAGAALPAGSTLTVRRVSGQWPARPTGRSDVVVQWVGPDPSPAIVDSGTAGMRNNVDLRFVTP